MYKVVKVMRDGKGGMWSATNFLATEYRQDQWVKAPVGGLLVFEGRMQAIHFSRNMATPTDDDLCEYQVWECDVLEEVALPKGRLAHRYGVEDRELSGLMSDLWSGKEVRVLFTEDWPIGTRAYKLVKLTKRVM